MVDWIESRLKSKTDYSRYEEYKESIQDLMDHEAVKSMEKYPQHGKMNCLNHCIFVSYYSFLLCKRLGLDSRSAARGGLLHDLFLYDWHTATRSDRGWHGFSHPYTALENADRLFELNEMEKDIIVKHMWPLTIKRPLYKESFIVLMVDKYCALVETVRRINGFSRAKYFDS